MRNKIVIIGCGNVGMSYAYALMNQRTNVHELALIDINEKKVKGEVSDLNHCLAFAPSKIKVKVGTYEDCADASIVCLAAGVNQNPGESRVDLINKNSIIFKSIIDKVMATNFNGIFLVATNPLDAMTYLTWKYSKLPPHQVIGSGTSLDTARLRYLLGEKLNINPHNIHAYVIGEHGDSEFVPWTNTSVGLKKISNYLTNYELDEIYVNVRDAAYEIIENKGSTCYGIGMCLVGITNAILGDENSIITVSTYDKDNDVYISLPTTVNRKGASSITYFELTQEEQEKLNNSVKTIKETISKIGLEKC